MSEELSRVEDLLENGVEEPVLPMSELEAILRGEKIKPHSRVAELLLQYNPSDILIEKSITENGTYYASADNAAGYFKVIVDTPVIPPVVLDHLVETITENGTYNYTPDHDGYSDAEITVNVPSVQPTLITKTITENGTYEAGDDNADGYSEVTVDVEGGGGGDPVEIQYLAYAKFEGTDPGLENTNFPLDVKEYAGYDEYLSYDSTNNCFNVLTDFQAILVPWVVNYQTGVHPAWIGLKLNNDWIIHCMVSPSKEMNSLGCISNSYLVLDGRGVTYPAQLDECTNGMYISLHAGDTLSIQKPVDYGWAHCYLKIYKIFDSTNNTDTFMDSIVNTSDTSTNLSCIIGSNASEPSEFYRYIPAVHGTIVLRQKYTKVLGQYEVENKVFFNGYHLTDYDTIPAEIYNYIPDIDVSGANWTDSTSATQDGWISIAKHTYNQLRCYTQSWGSYLSNIDIWAVVDLDGGNGQTLPWSDPYDVEPAPDITLNNAQISSINNKYMGAISTNLPIVAGYYAISHYNSDQIAGGTNLALVKIESLPTTITLSGLSQFRLNVTTNSVEVDNYDGSAKDVYMSIIKIPEYAICVKPD